MDPISDLLTRIRNAAAAKKRELLLPHSKIKEEIARVLKAKEFIAGYEVMKRMEKRLLRVNLRYDGKKRAPFSNLQRISTPGRRIYVGAGEIPRPLSGFGTAILSTTQGILTGEEARERKVGGEVLCYVW